MTSCRREAYAFQRATHNVEQMQAQILVALIKSHQNTEFGHKHQFHRINSLQNFQQFVPLSTYTDYAPAIQRISAGQPKVLTSDPVRLLEPTSGTTSGEKLIPFTHGLHQQFQRAIAPWIYNLLTQRPTLRSGRAYWSISPALGFQRRTSAGIPIGFDDDAAYLGRTSQWLLKYLLAVPPTVTRITALEEFRYHTLFHLLAAADLTLISIWSPTFLLALLAPLEKWADQLCDDLEHGSISLPDASPPTSLCRRPPYSAYRSRGTELHAIFNSRQSWPEKLRQIWPRLQLLSCWTEAGAAHYMPQLKTLFPTVEIQPKGLLATEGCVSFPLLNRVAPALAVRSHFFEFQESSAPHQIRLAHQLEIGGRYRVILTTAGGLYRYQLQDEILVAGFENQCPLLNFCGKADGVSDLVGEKLAEYFVQEILQQLLTRYEITPDFSLLVPVTHTAHYRLYLQGVQLLAAQKPALEATLDALLRQNPHYHYARNLGQLAPPMIKYLDPRAEPGWSIYQRHCLAQGQRPGNIKPKMLDRWPGWTELLDPLCIPRT